MADEKKPEKQPYSKPVLTDYGTLSSLTLGGSPGCLADGSSGMTMTSDVNLKENVVPVVW